MLREEARYLFRGSGANRTIDRIATLTALDKPVTFRDNKEGLIGMRVARGLEQPSDKPELYTDANGLIHQCAHCRRVRTVTRQVRWDWVPAWVAQRPADVGYTLCPACAKDVYPEERPRPA